MIKFSTEQEYSASQEIPMINNSANIKDFVREKYGERARQVTQLTVLTNISEAESCADGTCETNLDTSFGAFSNLYAQAELEGLPLEAIASSAGCGNPTALAGLKHGERVLDLGSGGCIDCFLAARQVGQNCHVTGLDMTAYMIMLAQKNAASLGVTNVDFIHGEMEQIPLPDASIDVVISNCVVCLSPDKDAVAHESFRILSPGGRLHISDMMSLGEVPETLRNDPEQWAACVTGAEDRDAYLSRLGNAGFTNISIEEEEGTARIYDLSAPAVISVKVVAFKPN